MPLTPASGSVAVTVPTGVPLAEFSSTAKVASLAEGTSFRSLTLTAKASLWVLSAESVTRTVTL